MFSLRDSCIICNTVTEECYDNVLKKTCERTKKTVKKGKKKLNLKKKKKIFKFKFLKKVVTNYKQKNNYL
jgi:hypothetical protein